ncbi:MAG: 16S rRNA (uracil(1498)-N(3))-methyltransferase [Bacteroidales bacterium]|nr:16S rRNA (uracil(1498)-N(3))-methyltransferase [Candidatus Minthousia equi]MDO4955614.1 16S rRNA (uracil(1498)-N(3))-methyltransferase [Bacteroidales bacterium]
MKEVRYFYTPDIATSSQLPDEEAQHALRVLRMHEGDEMVLMDGKGTYYQAEVLSSAGKHCVFQVNQTMPQEKAWKGHLHLAMAPTKNMDRTEWFAEKATEIGFDELTFLNCRWSERKVIKTERVDKILVSAMKQSHKAWKPILNEMMDFKKFVQQPFSGQRFIAHCHKDDLPELRNTIQNNTDALVLIGPEGDFSEEEVALAEQNGFVSISLGKSRLRTETAALVAVHIMQLFNS